GPAAGGPDRPAFDLAPLPGKLGMAVPARHAARPARASGPPALMAARLQVSGVRALPVEQEEGGDARTPARKVEGSAGECLAVADAVVERAAVQFGRLQ